MTRGLLKADTMERFLRVAEFFRVIVLLCFDLVQFAFGLDAFHFEGAVAYGGDVGVVVGLLAG
jgi:hypothetical protein